MIYLLEHSLFIYFVGSFNLSVPVDALSFVGSQLVAISYTGKIGVWNVMTQNWRVRAE